MTKILNGPNGPYKDDGENLSLVNQTGNGSEKAPSSEQVARKIKPSGD